MCIMSTVDQILVSSTRLFARLERDDQYLVYQMAIDAPTELVMVLPLPVATTAEDAIDFIDLSGSPRLFEQLNACFVPPQSRSRSVTLGVPAPQSLRVHRVGSFEASWVPTLADMDRLDPRFRLDDQVWHDLPQLADYGFAVFQLQAGAHVIHPMAMTFPTREPDTLFFPTIHVHDGAVHREAEFDHELYFQTVGRPHASVPAGMPTSMERPCNPPASQLDFAATRGVVVADQALYRIGLRGKRTNADTRVQVTST